MTGSDPSSGPPATLEPVADGVERSLPPEALVAARLAGGIAAAIVCGATAIATLSVLLASRPTGVRALLLLAGGTVLCAAVLAWGLLWPAVRHRHISYRVDAGGIRIRRGVLWRRETSVPKSRVQHTDVSRGPIERSLGLATLIVYTAGTEHASVSLSGLPEPRASHVRDYLLEGGDDDAV